MASVAFASERDCETNSTELHHLKRKVTCLQSETDLLARIIQLNQSTLEEINELVVTQLKKNQRQSICQLVMRLNSQDGQVGKADCRSPSFSQQISKQIDEAAQAIYRDFNKGYQNLMIEHYDELNQLKKALKLETARKSKEYQQDCDTSIEEYTSGRAIFEIPIEMQVLKEVTDTDVQVDLFSSSRSLIYEVPVEMHQIFEIPVELKEIYEVPIELNTQHFVQRNKIYEVPVEIEEIYEVELGGDGQGDKVILENVVIDQKQFLKYEEEISLLTQEIQRLVAEVALLKVEASQKKIYEIPVEIDYLGSEDLNKSQCHVDMPADIEIESQPNLDNPVKYNSLKQGSKVSTQFGTRPDLDIESPHRPNVDHKNSILVSTPGAIQEVESLASVNSKLRESFVNASSIRNFNLLINEGMNCEVLQDQRQPQVVFQGGVDMEIYGDLVEIEMHIMEDVEKCDQETQTDFVKERILKIPQLQVVEVPYEVERVVQRIAKIPTLQIVEIPTVIEEAPANLEETQQVKEVKLYSRRNIDEEAQISQQKPVLFSIPQDNIIPVPQVIIKQVPTEVIVERQLPAKVITKQVPIQVIIEKEVIVQKVVIHEIPVEMIVEKEIIVEHFIELPQKVVVKEVPYEVIIEKEVTVERVVELPAKTIIKEVPVEVIIEKIVYVPSPPIIKEIPIEVIVEKEVEVVVNQVVNLPQKTIIKQVPYEVILQVEKIIEVPKVIVKEVPIQVIVEQPGKTIIKEVPIEVQVEKIVHVYHEIPVQIPVQLIVEKPIYIQKIVEVPVIVECPVEIIVQRKVPVIKEVPYEVVIVEEVQKIVVKEIPVQVEVEVIKVVKEIVEVPVFVFMNADKPKEELFKEFDLSNLAEQPQQPAKLHSYDAHNQDDAFSNMKLLLQSNDPRSKTQPEHSHHIVEMPIEIIVEKEVQKIKEVIKVRQIPTEVVIVEEKETIVYVPVQKIVYVKQVVEIPVEVEVEKTVFVTKFVEIPVQVEVVVYRDRIVEVPVQVFVDKPVYKIKEIPIELMMEVEQESYEAQMEEVIVEQQVFPNSRVKLESISEFPSANLLNNNAQEDGHFEEVYEVPMGINYYNGDMVYEIDATNIRRGSGSFEEFVIHLPQDDTEVAECSAQTDPLPQAKERIKIVEIPMQVENINYQQVQKEAQLKYRETLIELRQRYEQEITELHSIMVNLQSVILQSNEEKFLLKEQMETNALNEQSLLKELELSAKGSSAEIERLKKEIEEVNEAKMQEVEELQREVEKLSRLKLNKVQVEQPRCKIWELPIEVVLEHETNELAIQTDDLNLGPFEVIEIPIQLQPTPLTEQQIIIPEEEPTEHVNLYAQKQYSIFQLVDFGCQVETMQKMIFELPVEINTANEVASAEIQTEFTVGQGQEIVLFRYNDCNPYDLENAEQIQVMEVPSEEANPVIYEIATQIEVVKECVDSHVQTEPEIQEKLIYEVPVQYNVLPQTQEAEVQATDLITLSSQGSLSEEEEKEQAEQEQQQQQQEFLMTGKSSKGFKGAWKASTLRSENKGSIFKKKPNSEYFTSRIFEIPVEIAINKENISKEIQTQEEKVLKSIEVQTETSQIDVRERLLEDAGFSRTVLSRQREITLANMKIVEAFEPVRVAAVTPKKSQKQIARLGSDNQAVNIYHTFSNAQSITPNQFDASASYDKFPVPNINISLIKKSSLHSQNKFFGSLDIREELLSQDEALASVRFASKKLTGFEQEESSQEGDIQGLSREMIIEENETIMSRDRNINQIQTPNLEPHDLNFSEYATLKEKEYQIEQEKVSHQQLYEASQTELDNIRRHLERKAEEVAQLKVQFDRETCKYEEEIRKLNEEVNYLHKENRQQALSGEAARTRVAELEEGKIKLEKQVQMLFDNWERLREEHLKSESSSTKEIERLRNIISEKIAEIKELKSDEHHQKEIFETQLNEYRDLVDKKSEVIDGLEEQLQRRGDRIEQLIEGLEEMRKNISNHNNQVDTAAIYEQQFQRVKECFQEEKKELNYQIYELKEIVEQLKEDIKEETRKNEELQANVVELQRAVEEARHQYSSLHHLKSELENNYMQGVKCLNQQLEEMKDLVREKDEIIQHRVGSSIEPPSSKMRIQYLSKQASQISPHDNNKSLEAYSRKLEQLLRKYERIIVQNQGTIEELQEKVYEYLKDALEKEQQAQGFYMKLVDYENTINNILVQKVTLDIENKRLTKQIELSQKKLNALGNRLIEVARKRADYDSDDEYYE